jgi:MoaD family protein
MQVRLFAALREMAGASQVEVDAADVDSLLDTVSARFGPAFDRVMRAGVVVVNGETASVSQPLASTDEVALLPPVSGG